MKKLISYVLALLLLSSCSYAFNDTLRKSAEEDIPFTYTQSDIERDIGAVFIWGGTVVNSEFSDTESYIEVVQSPLNKYGKIVDPRVSEGRFILYSPTRLDSEVYRNGRMLSVIGIIVKGIESTLDGTPYTYPVMEAINVRAWDMIDEDIPKASFPQGLSKLFPWSLTPPK